MKVVSKTSTFIILGLVVILLGFILVNISNVSKVYAIDDPDSISIESVKIFRNFTEENDQLWIVEYNIGYETNPSEHPSLAYYAGIGDGTSILYNKAVQSYGYNFISMYLTADQALTWEGSYFIHLSGNLGLFVSLTLGVNQTLIAVNSSDWDTNTDTDDVREAVGVHVLNVVNNVEVYTGNDYITEGGLLSTSGGDLVEGTVPNGREYFPEIFSIVQVNLPAPTPTYTQNFQATLEANRGERLDTALDQLGSTFLGASDKGEIVGTIGFLLIAITILGTIYATTKNSNGALLATLPLLYVGNVIGVIPLALMFTAFTFIVVLFGLTFILSRAG